MTTKYVARFNDAIVGKRTTKDRTYTHAIVVQTPTPSNYYFGKGSTKYDNPVIVAWAGRLDLAQKAANQYRGLYEVVAIVPAEIT
jgi:hypothetical protein